MTSEVTSQLDQSEKELPVQGSECPKHGAGVFAHAPPHRATRGQQRAVAPSAAACRSQSPSPRLARLSPSASLEFPFPSPPPEGSIHFHWLVLVLSRVRSFVDLSLPSLFMHVPYMFWPHLQH